MPLEKIHLLPASYLNCFSVLKGLTGAFRLENAADRDSYPYFSCNVVVLPADEVVAPHSSVLISSCHGWLEHWLLCAWMCYNMHGCFSDSSFLPEMKQHYVKTGIHHVSREGRWKNSTSRKLRLECSLIPGNIPSLQFWGGSTTFMWVREVTLKPALSVNKVRTGSGAKRVSGLRQGLGRSQSQTKRLSHSLRRLTVSVSVQTHTDSVGQRLCCFGFPTHAIM